MAADALFDTIDQLRAAVDPGRFNTRSARRASRKFLTRTLGMCGLGRRDYVVVQVLKVEYPADEQHWDVNRIDHIKLRLAGVEMGAVVSWTKWSRASKSMRAAWEVTLNYQGLTCSVLVPANDRCEKFEIDWNLWRPLREQTIQNLQSFLAQVACLVVND